MCLFQWILYSSSVELSTSQCLCVMHKFDSLQSVRRGERARASKQSLNVSMSSQRFVVPFRRYSYTYPTSSNVWYIMCLLLEIFSRALFGSLVKRWISVEQPFRSHYVSLRIKSPSSSKRNETKWNHWSCIMMCVERHVLLQYSHIKYALTC